jgi:hypothetical protein
VAIWKVIATFSVALFIFAVPAKAGQCITIDTFVSTFASKGIKSYGSKSVATAKMEAVLNTNRTNAGKQKIDAAAFIVAYAKKDNDVVVIVGVVDANGCFYEETMTTLTADQWVGFLESSGVELEEFVALEGA